MTYDESLTALEDGLYGVITDLTALPIRIRNKSAQKINEQHIQLHIREIEDIGWYHGEMFEEVSGNEITAKEYEVMVDIACHAGNRTQTVLNKILHALSSGSGLYYKYFETTSISFLRASSITRRDWPLDKVQFEERSQITVVFSMMVEQVDAFDLGSIETVEIVNLKTKVSDNVTAVDDTLTITYP